MLSIGFVLIRVLHIIHIQGFEEIPYTNLLWYSLIKRANLSRSKIAVRASLLTSFVLDITLIVFSYDNNSQRVPGLASSLSIADV